MDYPVTYPTPPATVDPKLDFVKYAAGEYLIRVRDEKTYAGTVFRCAGDWTAISDDGAIRRQGRTRVLAARRMIAARG